jgi:integration host factor subunit alpha
MTLTKAPIIKSIRRQTGFTKKKSVEIVEIMLETIKRSLDSGNDVLISGFGKFCVKHKRERRGRNPVTGENIMITSRRVITFKCSRKLRAMLNKQ